MSESSLHVTSLQSVGANEMPLARSQSLGFVVATQHSHTCVCVHMCVRVGVYAYVCACVCVCVCRSYLTALSWTSYLSPCGLMLSRWTGIRARQTSTKANAPKGKELNGPGCIPSHQIFLHIHSGAVTIARAPVPPISASPRLGFQSTLAQPARPWP